MTPTTTEFLAARRSDGLPDLLTAFFGGLEGSGGIADAPTRGPFDALYEVYAAAGARAVIPRELESAASLSSARAALLRLFRLTCDRILLHRLHVARDRGLLAGGCEQARRRSFLERVLGQRLLAPLLAGHPVAAASLIGGVSRMRASVHSCVDDLRALRKAPGQVTAIEFLDDDGHSWRTQHVKLSFGEDERWILKHRSSACDRVVLERMSELVPDFPVRAEDMFVDVSADAHFVRFLREDEGWALPHPGALGALLALSQRVGIADLHKDNVLRVAGQLVPIDCEVIGSLQLDERFACRAVRSASIDESLLLPFGARQRRALAGMLRGAALSALELRRMVWRGAEGDHPTLVEEERPGPEPVPIPPEWLRALETHYERAARQLWADRARLRDRITTGLRGSECRVVLRATSAYGQLLDYAWSGGAASGAYLYAKLKRSASHFPLGILRAEAHALGLGLFPAFYQPFEGSTLEDASGRAVATLTPPRARVEQSVLGLEEAAIPRSVLLLRDSVAAMFPASAEALVEERAAVRSAGETAAWISGILDGVEESGGVARAHSVKECQDGAWLADGAGADLYEGSSGVMYAWTRGAVERRNRAWGGLRKLARVSLAALAAGEKGPYLMGTGRGLFTGPTGVALVCAAQDCTALKELAAALAELTCRAAEGLEMGDVIDGLLGVGLGLVTLKEMQIPLPRSASRVANRIVEALSCEDLGSMLRRRRFVGLAHGVAGDLLTGYRLARSLGSSSLVERMQRTAEALAAELLHDRRFVQAHASRSGAELLPTGWCHGISGILSAIAVIGREHPALTRLVDEIARGLGPGDVRSDNLSLCHGMAGELICFSVAAEMTRSSAAGALRARIERDIEAATRVRAGSLPGATPVGYMTGLAGIQDGLRAVGTRDGWRSTLLARLYGA
ncbi:lanthionine synthetase LanC family protein [Sorangium sp. So ce1151]|uniref:lanthionine synthetase LanC family protein n=1 Tax=Sorangium sp. So ce1151 TaxID=3133332 RepID=UPI003F640B45